MALVAVRGNFSAASGRGSPFHSLGDLMLGRALFLLTFTCLSANAVADSALTAAEVTKQIRMMGAHSALQSSYSDESKWSRVIAGIATGAKDWLVVANLLHPASDAGSSEQLGLAVGEALEHHPENVLTLSVTEFGIENICGGPDVDDKRFDSYELSMAAIAKRKKMLLKVHDTQLRELRDFCASTLESSKKGIANFYGVKQ